MVSVSPLIPHPPWLNILLVSVHSNENICIHNMDGPARVNMA